jgi:hypothetical protein
VVTKNGVKISSPAPLSEANAQAESQRQLLESSGQQAVIAVVPVLLG